MIYGYRNSLLPGGVVVKRLWIGLLMSIGLGLSTQYVAAEESRVPEVSPELWSKFNSINKNATKKAALLEKAKERGLFCASCHGKDGNGTRPHIPKLAGQNPAYVLEQLEKFSDGRRSHYVMVPLAKEFTDEDKIGFAFYFSQFEMIPAGGDARLAVMGKKVFEAACIHCHGVDGRGSKGYSRLAGQMPVYVRKALQHYRDKYGDRKSVLMEQVTQSLTDDQIDALAEYIGTMK